MKKILLSLVLILTLTIGVSAGVLDLYWGTGFYSLNTAGIGAVWKFAANSTNPLITKGSQSNEGTFTYTSAASRSYIDNGVMQFEADDTKPIYEWVGGKRALRIEPQGENLLLDSRNIDSGSTYWSSQDEGTASQNATGVDGGANKATTIRDTDSDSGDYYRIRQHLDVTVGDGVYYCSSIYIKKTTGATTFPLFGITFHEGGTVNYAMSFINTNTGVVSNYATVTQATGVSTGCIDVGDWLRVWVSGADSDGSNEKVQYAIFPAASTNGTSVGDGTETGSVIVDCAQLEYNKKFPSSYVDNDGVVLGGDQVVDGGFVNSTLGDELWDSAASVFTSSNVTINNGAGYIIGTNSMTVDAIPFKLVVGTKLVFSGGGEYIITTEAAASATTILSTSGLTDAAVADDEAAPSGTYGWTKSANNTISNDANSLKITYVDNASGAFIYFSDSDDLSADMVVGKRYRFQVDAKKGVGDTLNLRFYDSSGGTVYQAVTGTTFDTYTFYFTCRDASGTPNGVALNTIDLSVGECCWLDNLSLKEVTPDDWNEGDYVGHTGSADTVTVTGDQTDTITVEQSYMDWSKPCWEAADFPGTLVVTDGNTITATTMTRAIDIHKLRDMGAADYFDTTSNFTHYVDTKYTAVVGSGGIAPWAICSEDDDLANIVAGGATHHGVFIWMTNDIAIYEIDDGVLSNPSSSAELTPNTTYYLTIRCVGGSPGTMYVDIYSDAARTTLVETISETLTMDHTHDHIGVVGYNTGSAGVNWSGTIENLSIYEKPVAGYIYQITHTADEDTDGGSYHMEYGSTVGETISADGTYYDYVTATDNDVLKVVFDDSWNGTVDDIAVKKMGQGRLTEESSGGATGLTFPLVTPVSGQPGTLIIWLYPTYSQATLAASGWPYLSVMSMANSHSNILWYRGTNDVLASFCSGPSTRAEIDPNWAANSWIKMGVKWETGTNTMNVGYDDGSGFTWGTPDDFDGDYAAAAAKMQFGYLVGGPTYFSDMLIVPKVLTATEIDAIGGSP